MGRRLFIARVGAVGVGTGVLTGFFGVGGGLLIVPALALFLGLSLTLAVGTSLLVIALTSAAAFVAHLVSGSIDWAVALTFTAAAIAVPWQAAAWATTLSRGGSASSSRCS